MIFRTIAIIVTAFLIIFLTEVAAEEPAVAQSTQKSNADIDYSESVPYTPQLVAAQKDSDKKKRSKDEKNRNPQRNAAGVSFPLGTLTIPVTVATANNTTVRGLTISDFKVFIGDEQQVVKSVETEAVSKNLVLLIDASPSGFDVLEKTKKLFKNIVNEIGPENRVLVAQFAMTTKILTDFTTDRNVILKAIDHANMSDGTSLYDSVSQILQAKLSNVDGSTTVILMTDGIDTTSRKATFDQSLIEAERGRASIVTIYFDSFDFQSKFPSPLQSLVLNSQIMHNQVSRADRDRGATFLLELTKLSGGIGIVYPYSGGDSSGLSTSIATLLKSQYVLTIETSSSVIVGTRRPMRVRVERPGLTVLAKGSFFGGN